MRARRATVSVRRSHVVPVPALNRKIAILLAAAIASAYPRTTQPPDQAWRDPSLSDDVRAVAALRAMTLDEKIAVVHTHVGTPFKGKPKPPGAIGSAAVWPGVPRLGIPPQQESDGGLGVANPLRLPALYNVTPLPSEMAIAATFDPVLARAGGAMIGRQARNHGFGILLAGGANLIRDPRDGRSFEYASEDPLVTGRMVGAVIAGVQSAGVVCTLKHFAINDEETGRIVMSADLRQAAARESDLLAFEIALEQGHPGAVMTSYNRVNGTYTSENAPLVATLKRDWHYPGFVMSDWGGTHSTRDAALAGLDQQSGEEYDNAAYFAEPLKRAVEDGKVPQDRLDDMVHRVLRSIYAGGAVDHPPDATGAVDLQADRAIARVVAASGIVVLKNDGGALPLRSDLRRIVVVGAHANLGVLSGGGSSQVIPKGSQPFSQEQPKRTILGIKYYHPSVPTDAIRQHAPGTDVVFVDGNDHQAAAEAARGADKVIIFAEQWLAESRDAPNLSLPSEQDQLIKAVAAANSRVVVVLETGSAVTMPWLDHVPAVMEAWYPGAGGAEAIADVLFGVVNSSGRLPITFPRSEAQLPRPSLPEPGAGAAHPGGSDLGGFDIDYDTEGADVGYRWFAKGGLKPLFSFGFGLSYTRFSYDALKIRATGASVEASVEVRNEGQRDGIDTPQVYVEASGSNLSQRLVGWDRVSLAKGEARRIAITIDPRLLARFDVEKHAWIVAAGRYSFSVKPNASANGLESTINLDGAQLAP